MLDEIEMLKARIDMLENLIIIRVKNSYMLKARVDMLEKLIISASKDSYIDNWGWYEKNEEQLRTIPGYRLPYTNEIDDKGAT